MELAVLYFRVSRKKQIHGIDAQIHFVNEYLLLSGKVAMREYSEIESGKNEHSPELEKAIRYCKRTGATLFFSTMSRLSRKALLVARLMIKKIKFIAADKPDATQLNRLFAHEKPIEINVCNLRYVVPETVIEPVVIEAQVENRKL